MTIGYLLHLLAVVSALQGCLSKETSCVAMETSNGTIYAVSDITDSNCDFSWINSSNHVMANVGGNIEEIIISSNSTHLHTHSCYETMLYYWDCMSEMSTRATCHVNCSRNAESPAKPGNPFVWLVWLVVIVACCLGISVILFFVCRTVFPRLKKQHYTGGKPSDLPQAEMALQSR